MRGANIQNTDGPSGQVSEPISKVSIGWAQTARAIFTSKKALAKAKVSPSGELELESKDVR